jgi:uncharacterized membrane protein (UPF0127 family)
VTAANVGFGNTPCRRPALRGKGVCRVQRLVENGGGFSQADGMKLIKMLPLLLAASLLAGCKKTETTAPSPPVPTVDNRLPTQAQPKLPTIKIYLGAEQLDAELAHTAEQEHTGMMFRTNITDESAMLFVLPEPIRAPNGFWMTNCPVSLSAAYIGPDGVIEEIHHLEKNDNKAVVAINDNIVFVLEVNDGWFARHNINPGTVIRTDKGSLAETFFRN